MNKSAGQECSIPGTGHTKTAQQYHRSQKGNFKSFSLAGPGKELLDLGAQAILRQFNNTTASQEGQFCSWAYTTEDRKDPLLPPFA